jgi:predicted lipoprotein with Yx(FWY)xxD motif
VITDKENTMNIPVSRPLAAAAGAASLALLAVGCGSSSPSTSASAATSAPAYSSSSAPSVSAAAAVLKTEHTSLGTVLADDRGYTLYWFSKDTATTSACTGSCTTYWPPVIGTPQAASGVTLSGKLGTITRPGGAIQATYDGHPLYTYAGDKAPGQASGNNLNLNGGVWHAVTTGAAPAATPSASASSSSGYGY